MPAAQAYDPTNTQPYQPTEAPQVAAPQPSPLPTQAPQANGWVQHSGGIATIADSVLRGYMQGRAIKDARTAMQAKKKADDLNASYNNDAQRLYQMHQAGVDESSDEYKQAKSAVDGSWGALQEYRGQLIDQHSGKKNGSKGKQDELPPALVIQNPASTPHEKAAAIYAISQKVGPPVYGQIAMGKTAQAQAAKKAAETQGQADVVHAQNSLTHEQAQSIYNKYAGKSEDEMSKLPEAERQSYANARAVLNPPTSKGTTKLYESADKKSKEWYVPGSEPEGWSASSASGTTHLYTLKDGTHNWFHPGSEPEGASAVAPGAAPKVGSFGDFMVAAYGEHPTPKQYTEGNEIWAKSKASTTTGEHTVMVPQPDGSIKPVVVMTTSTKTFGGSPTVLGARQDAPAAAPPAAQPAHTAPSSAHSGTAPASDYRPTPRRNRAGVVAVGDAVGGRATPTQTKADEDVLAATKLNSLAVQALKSNEPGQQRQLALSLIKGMAGRVNMQEYAIYTKGYGVENTVDGLIKGIESGRMPPEVVHQLARDAFANLKAAKEARDDAYGSRAQAGGPPKDASDEVYAADGKTLIGHVVKGKFVKLGG